MIKKAYLLKGHTRPITQVSFNREGDLLFAASKDGDTTLWRTVDGHRVGVYHTTGAIRGISVSPDSRFLATAGADENLYVFDVKTGERLADFHHLVATVDADWSMGSDRLLLVTDMVRGQLTHVFTFQWDSEARKLTQEPDDIATALPPSHTAESKVPEKARVTQAKWGPLDESVLLTTTNGELFVYSVAQRAVVQTLQHHTNVITSLVFDPYKLLYMTASKDGTALLYNARTHELLKKYVTGRPVNACSISPVKDEVLLGGGQEARDVTTSSVDQRQFMAHFFDLVQEKLVGLVKGHFSPVNCVSYSPDGRAFVTGGEDGNVHLYHFGKEYFADPDI